MDSLFRMIHRTCGTVYVGWSFAPDATGELPNAPLTTDYLVSRGFCGREGANNREMRKRERRK